MIDARDYLRKHDDGGDGPGWLALGAGLGWLAVALLAVSILVTVRLGAWSVEAQAAADCQTRAAMASLADLAAHRPVAPSDCPELEGGE
jgi:hypothetical protein